MTSKSLTILAIFLLSAVVAGSVLFWQGSNQENSLNNALESTQKQGKNILASASQTLRSVLTIDQEEETASHPKGAPGTEESRSLSTTQSSNPNPTSPPVQANTDNLTDAFSKVLAQEIIKTGINQDNLENNFPMIEQDLLKSHPGTETLFSPPEISDKEINLSEDNSKSSREHYITKMSAILETNLSDLEKNEIAALYEAIQTKNFTPLKIYSEIYEKIYSQIKRLSTPIFWKKIHKKQLSIIKVNSLMFDAVSKAKEDPLKAIVALHRYSELYKTSEELSQEIQTKIKVIKKE